MGERQILYGSRSAVGDQDPFRKLGDGITAHRSCVAKVLEEVLTTLREIVYNDIGYGIGKEQIRENGRSSAARILVV